MHATPTEIHDVAYGFSDAAPHITDCATCTRSLDRVRSERDALRRTLQAPAPTASRPWMGVAAAALFLVALAAFIILQPGLVTTPARQDPPRKPTLAELVQKFAGGDDSVRAQILATGAPAMHPLLTHRGTARVDKLREDIRRAAAQADSRDIAELLEARKHGAVYSGTVQSVLSQLSSGIAPMEWQAPWIIDPGDWTLAEKQIRVELSDDSDGAALDKICAAIDADCAYVYGAAVICKPERLWPRDATPPAPLTEDERATARALIADLGDDSAEKRDAAFSALLKRGESVLPLLDAGAKDADAQLAANCTALIKKLRPPAVKLAYPPVAASLNMSDDASAAKVKDIREKRITFAIKDLTVPITLKLLQGQFVGSEFVGDLPDTKVTTHIENATIWTALCFLTRPYGLDFIVEKGIVKIGTEEQIRAIHPAPPKRE